MTKTANDLMIAPPSLSLTISRLEHELGTTFLDRVGRRIPSMNAAGHSWSISI
jgi:DNA-binding transcriptional LysR family regulator